MMKSIFAIAMVSVLLTSWTNAAPQILERMERMSMPTLSNRVIAQFLDSLPVYNMPVYLQRQRAERMFNDDDGVVSSLKKKRNNAEIVNHILRNTGDISRLGDVGRR